jgi:hypothetical protein
MDSVVKLSGIVLNAVAPRKQLKRALKILRYLLMALHVLCPKSFYLPRYKTFLRLCVGTLVFVTFHYLQPSLTFSRRPESSNYLLFLY